MIDEIILILILLAFGILIWYVETHNLFEDEERQQDDSRRKKTKRN